MDLARFQNRMRDPYCCTGLADIAPAEGPPPPPAGGPPPPPDLKPTDTPLPQPDLPTPTDVGTPLDQGPTTFTKMNAPGGATNQLTSVWGRSATDVWTVGSGGAVWRLDGGKWKALPSTSTKYLNTVTGFGATDVIVAGNDHALMRCAPASGCGPPSLLKSSTYNKHAWRDVWCFAAYCLMVGYDNNASGAGRYYRVSTSGVATPCPHGSPEMSGKLMGLWAADLNNAVLVGTGGNVFHVGPSSRKSRSIPASPNYLHDAWGASLTDIWVVGSTVKLGGKQAAVAHWDGNKWTVVNPGVAETLLAVWGRSSSDVWAVGHLGKVVHYDGAKWSTVSVPSTKALFGVWGTTSGQVFVVGAGGTILRRK